MSQAKVDQYKEFKKNRKEILAKEQKQKDNHKKLTVVIACALALALLAALGITGANAIKDKKASAPVYAREAMVVEDVAGVLNEAPETEEADATEASEDQPQETEAGEEASSEG